jgi:hypothetical protein
MPDTEDQRGLDKYTDEHLIQPLPPFVKGAQFSTIPNRCLL